MLLFASLLIALAFAPSIRVQAASYIAQPQERYRIMVFGDRMATGLLAGLWRVLKGDDRFEAKGRLREGTGLARPGFYDWRQVVANTLDSRPVDIGIVMLGANDARDIRMGDVTLPFGSPEWDKAYAERWNRLISEFLKRRVALYIVGLPPVRDKALNEKLKHIAAIIRAQAEANGVRYIDIYREFANDEGEFTENGFDVNGLFRRLRARNGVQFIKPGNTKLASLVASVMLKDVDVVEKGSGEVAQDGAKPPSTAAAQRVLVGMETPTGGAWIVPEELLPEENAPIVAEGEGQGSYTLSRLRRLVAKESVAGRLFRDGIWPGAQPGRSDDFSFPPR
ncbi:DUF459 domain-containing protein [Thermopetrobacter sp. TC1]|uniref:SGNH/GDSL hydrolase family protein n=1 Tax=Thermopetrobacter sp. TC1 TaxID=1495045 RepID=UPI001E289033|nr:DUF459 domain-containing protein [Thermopetrobacter sp. TC1]